MNGLPELLKIINQKIYSHRLRYHRRINRNTIIDFIESEIDFFPTDMERLEDFLEEHYYQPFTDDESIMEYFIDSVEQFEDSMRSDNVYCLGEAEIQLLLLLFQERFITPLITFKEFISDEIV